MKAKRLKRAIQFAFSAVLLAGCALSSAGTSFYVYLPFSARNELGIFSLTAATATLVSADPSYATVATAPAGVAATASGAYLAVTSSTNSTITVYSVTASTGQLTATDLKVTGTTPGTVVADPNNRYFYVANTGGGTISAYSLNTTTGALTLVDTETAVTGITQMMVNPAGSVLYAVSPTQNSLLAFTIDGTGALSALQTVTFTSVDAIAIHPSRAFLYAAGGTSIVPYSIASNGALSALTTLTESASVTGLAIDPVSGSQLYASVSNGTTTAGSLSTLAVDSSTGLLTRSASNSVGKQPTQVLMDSTGQSLLVVNNSSGSISVFTRSATTGVLTAFAGSPIAVGSSPGLLGMAAR